MPRRAPVYDVFLSYSHQDQEWVATLAERLDKDGFAIFLDEDSIEYGQNIPQAIEEAVSRSLRILFVVSQASLRSEWTKFETSLVFEAVHLRGSAKMIPVLLQKVGLPPSLARIKGIDFTGKDFESPYRKLLKSLKHPSSLAFGPAMVRNIHDIGELTESLTSRIGSYFEYPQDSIFSFVLACHELLRNALEHPSVRPPEAILTCDIQRNSILVKVTDRGTGFNLSAYLPPKRNEPSSGKKLWNGLTLVSSQCAVLRSETSEGEHSVWVIIKKQSKLSQLVQSWQEASRGPARNVLFTIVKLPGARWIYVRADVPSITLYHDGALLRLAGKILADPERPKHVVLDLTYVRFLDSSGSGELVAFYSELVQAGIELWLIVPSDSKILDLLIVSRLSEIFNIFPDKESALEGLKAKELAGLE